MSVYGVQLRHLQAEMRGQSVVADVQSQSGELLNALQPFVECGAVDMQGGGGMLGIAGVIEIHPQGFNQLTVPGV